MALKSDDQTVQIPLPDEINKSGLNRSIQAGLKRFSKGFLKTIGISTPIPSSAMGMSMGERGFSALRDRLADAYAVENVSLDNGLVPSQVDLLLLVAPEQLNQKQLFAVDQFLMKGGTVMLATSTFDINVDRTLICRKVDSGLEGWLHKYGIDIEKTMVLDSQNFPLPLPRHRMVAGFAVDETALAPYPYFVDVRGEGLDSKERIAAGISQVVMNWPSPIRVDKTKDEQRRIVELLHSSPDSWTSSETHIDPNYSALQPLGFPVGKDKGKKVLAVAIEGSFQSYFNGKESPLINQTSEQASEKNNTGGSVPAATATPEMKEASLFTNVINKSPESARIIVFASNMFLSDKMLWLASASLGSQYLNPIELIENAADWSLEDRDLLAIRGRGHFARTLRPMSQGVEIFFEYLNYGLACAGLLAVWLLKSYFSSRTRKKFEQLLESALKADTVEEVKS
jgi:ABC-2 type transport system permease protein